MTTIDYPKALDATDIETVVAAIQATYSTHEIQTHDAGTLHFGYWDKSERSVDATLLRHIQAAGYALIQVGRERAPANGQWCGWMECRKYASGERARMLTCPRCDCTFTPVTVAHRVAGPGSALYACPGSACSNRFEAAPPRPALSDASGGDAR